MTLLEDIVAYLVAKELAIGDGQDIFRDFQPPTPDNVISLHEYGGGDTSPYTEIVNRSVQVVVRNQSAAESQRIARELYKAFVVLDASCRIDFTPSRWGQVHVRQTPYKIKQDDMNRVHYGFNLGITTTID